MARVDQTQADEMFMAIASKAGGIEPMLKSFFSFLHRKTDFYVEFDPTLGQNATMGFPPGVAERMVIQQFRSFPTKKYNTGIQCKESKAASTPEDTSHTVETQSQTVPSTSTLPQVRYTEEGKQIPMGNGGVTPKYHWTQSLYELTVYAFLPKGTRAADVHCKISPKSLELSLKSEKSPIINGNFPETVRPDESVWIVEDDSAGEFATVIISLDKIKRTWWGCVVEGDPEIDTTMVDSTCKIDEYDSQTQGAIRKIMFDQKQKAMGLPTSDDLATDEILEKAKFLPGSPFLETNGLK